MKAPERIWATGGDKGGDWGSRNGLCHTFGGTKYIRADLHEAEIARLTAERDAALAAERATTIEAAVNAADSAGMSLKPASGWDERDVAWWETGGLDHILAATDAIRALEPQPITVHDAARVLLNDDIAISKMAEGIHDGPLLADDYQFSAAHPQGSWCVDAVRAALRAIAEQEGR